MAGTGVIVIDVEETSTNSTTPANASLLSLFCLPLFPSITKYILETGWHGNFTSRLKNLTSHQPELPLEASSFRVPTGR